MNELLNRIHAELPKIDGWCSKEKADEFAKEIVSSMPDICVEIGVFGGSSLIPQAMSLHHNSRGMTYGIDPWERVACLENMTNPGNLKWWGEVNLDAIYQGCREHIQRLGVGDYCELIKDRSENVVGRFEDDSIGVLHIDGNHCEERSLNDATLYLPKVKKSGVIFFDDITWSEDGTHVTTQKALQFLLLHCSIAGAVKDCLILRKN